MISVSIVTYTPTKKINSGKDKVLNDSLLYLISNQLIKQIVIVDNSPFPAFKWTLDLDKKIQYKFLNGNNLGGRPKISPLRESLVMRLRKEGCSYRSIRTQTGIALSTIRRIILDGEAN